MGSNNKGEERLGECPSWIIKDWPRLKSAMVKQAKLICNTLLMEAVHKDERQLKDSTQQWSQKMGNGLRIRRNVNAN